MSTNLPRRTRNANCSHRWKILAGLIAATLCLAQPLAVAAPGESATFYLHGSGLLVGNDAIEPGNFDHGAPWGKNPSGIQLGASWWGVVGKAFDRLDLRFWHVAPSAVGSEVTYNFRIYAGGREFCLPWVTVPGAAEPTLVTTSFQTVRDTCNTFEVGGEEPMLIDGRKDSIGLAVTVFFGSPDATILFDSVDFPTSFSIREADAGDLPPIEPDPSPQPSFVCSETSEAGVPSDPFAPCQWAPLNIHAYDAWELEHASGEGITVAILDTGVDVDHEDLQCPGKLVVPEGAEVFDGDGSVDDRHGHGTHVAGIVGSCANNDIGTAGIAPDARIMPVQVLNDSGRGPTSDIAAGIRLATNAGAHVINLSLGNVFTNEFGSSGLIDAVHYATERGVVVVASAGNDGAILDATLDKTRVRVANPCGTPAIFEDVICVGATDREDGITNYSNNANKLYPDRSSNALVAPGGEGSAGCPDYAHSILSLYPMDAWNVCAPGYAALDGTSMAAPHVAGVAALVYERLGGIRSPEALATVRGALLSTARDLGEPGYDSIYGWGLLDAAAAVASVPTRSECRLDLRFDGPGDSRNHLLATLASTFSGAPLTGQSIRFLAEGREIAAGITGASGDARGEIPPEARRAGVSYGAVFDGTSSVERCESPLLVK